MKKLVLSLVLALGCDLGAFAEVPPNGSYLQTCRDATSEYGGLLAICQTRSGNWQKSMLVNFSSCVSDIVNNNGNLQCCRVDFPLGSYNQSCNSLRLNGNDLIAKCKNMRGIWVDSLLRNYQICQVNTIDNLDGILVCNRSNVNNLPAMPPNHNQQPIV